MARVWSEIRFKSRLKGIRSRVKTFYVQYDYIEKNGVELPEIDEKYTQAETINEALAKAQANVPDNQRVIAVREYGEAIV